MVGLLPRPFLQAGCIELTGSSVQSAYLSLYLVLVSATFKLQTLHTISKGRCQKHPEGGGVYYLGDVDHFHLF